MNIFSTDCLISFFGSLKIKMEYHHVMSKKIRNYLLSRKNLITKMKNPKIKPKKIP